MKNVCECGGECRREREGKSSKNGVLVLSGSVDVGVILEWPWFGFAVKRGGGSFSVPK